MINGKANTIMIQNSASVLYITIALIVATIVQAIVNLVMGYFSDKTGRKPVTIALAIINAISMTVFFFYVAGIEALKSSDFSLAGFGVSIFSGTCFGLALASYMCLFDQIGLIVAESCTTKYRSTVMGCTSFFRIGSVIAIIAQAVLAIALVPTAYVCYLLSIPFVIGSCVLIMLKVKETKGLSIKTIDADFE